MDITISASACSEDVYLLWDTVWDRQTQQGLWALAEPDEINNIGGFRSKSAIETAIIIALFTDRACPPDHPLFKFVDGDPRGWWGDGILFDDEDGPMGSLLWLLERSVTQATGIDMAAWAQTFALEALAFLITQKVVARVTASATVHPARHGLVLDIAAYGQAGSVSYSATFDILWQQVR